MRASTILYTLKQGLKNIYRNKMFSLASMATMAACIFMFSLFFAIVTNFSFMVKEAESGVGVTVFFNEGMTTEQIQAIGAQIEQREEVDHLEYVSAEEAWEQYKEDYLKGAEELAEGFEQDNPLANCAHYEIYLKDVEGQQSLVEYLNTLQGQGVRRVNQSEAVANTLGGVNRLISYMSITIIGILLFVAIFLINNTVTIGIAVRKEEIAIMKLIGATDFFVRAPFIVEGILIGLIGAALPLTAFYFLYKQVIQVIEEKFSVLSGILQFLPAGELYRILLPVGLILGIGIGFLGSFITIRKHLKV
ncbi:MAG: permease-like cell division protein FtsX [Oscillospiraceae bacterium]|nr:permease-like cell division protein FtsX [Oscillospiraceae bacterium]